MRFRISRGESNHNAMSRGLGVIFKVMDKREEAIRKISTETTD
jgi:hypothetical protein